MRNSHPSRSRMSLAGIAAGMLIFFSVSERSLHGMDLSIESEQNIFEQDSGPWSGGHAATIVQTANGTIMAAWRRDIDRVPNNQAWRSTFINGKWTTPKVIASGAELGKDYTLENVTLFQPTNGPLMLFYYAGPRPVFDRENMKVGAENMWGVRKTSTDNGATWSAPRALGNDARIAGGKLCGPTKNPPIQLPDGSILIPSGNEPGLLQGSSQNLNEKRFENLTWHFEKSTDLGQTWSVVQVLPANPYRAIQPGFLVLGGGKLIALGRNEGKGNDTPMATSTNWGQSWTDISGLAALPQSHSAIAPRTLRDGTHICILNKPVPGCPPRDELDLMVSANGTDWKLGLMLNPAGDGKVANYPQAVQTSDGKLHVVFTYARDQTAKTWEDRVIRHIIVRTGLEDQEKNTIAPKAAPTAGAPPMEKAASFPTQSQSVNIDVDLAGNLHNGINHRVGLCLNHLRDEDHPDLRRAITENRLTSLRFNEGETGDYWVFDRGRPNQGLARPQDPAIWFNRNLVDAQGCWKATLQLNHFKDLLLATRTTGYLIFAIDPYQYTGGADAFLAGKTKAQRLEWLKQTAKDLALHLKNESLHVTHIEIGNEQDIKGGMFKPGLGDPWTASEYGDVAAALAGVFHASNPALKIGVNGMPGKSDPWFDDLLPKVKGKVDFLVTHSYSKWLKGYVGWRDGNGWRYDGAVRVAKSALSKQGMRLPIAVTEFNGLDANGPQRNHWHALSTLNMILQHMQNPEVDVMHYWASRWMTEGFSCNLFAPNSHELSPIGRGVRLFTECAQSRMADYGDTSQINWAGTVNPATGETTIFLINRKDASQSVAVTLSGFAGSSANTVRWLRAGGDQPMSSNNDFSEGTPVALSGGDNRSFTLELPKVSAVAVRFRGKAKQP